MKCCYHIWAGGAQSSHPRHEYEIIYATLRGKTYFPCCIHSPTVETFQVYCNINAISKGKCSDERNSLVLAVQALTAKKRHVSSTMLNHLHFLRVPQVKRNCNAVCFPQELPLCEADIRVAASPNTSIVTSSSQESIAIFPSYSQSLRFLLSHSLLPSRLHSSTISGSQAF